MKPSLLFVVLPWHSLNNPALGVSILKSLVHKIRPQWQVDVLYANLLWADYVFESISAKEYATIGDELFQEGAGEWAFASALHDAAEWKVSEFRDGFPGSDEDFELVHRAHKLAPQFIQHLARRVANLRPDVVALTSTFTQNAACLSAAQAIKKLLPTTIIVMGGGNCDGEQGIALHRNFRQLDFVVRGEGESALPLLLDSILGSCEYASVPGLVWRSDTGSIANNELPVSAMDDVPIPDFDDYFQQLEAARVAQYVEPQLMIETARGCWWGEKHHCTFCGLNGTAMKFRSKSPRRAVDEIEYLASRHQVLDIVIADNIIAMDYFKTVLPEIASRDWDLRLHYEVKSNLKKEQIALLKQAGVLHIQPGIESLSSRVLKLMEKGVTGTRNVEVLRDCEESQLTVSWNYLAGFPGETEEDYIPIITQLPSLYHLQPPTATVRVVIERFSPYFDKPWLGFPKKAPAPHYFSIYSVAPSELEQMVFLFDAPHAGIRDEVLQDLQDTTAKWRSVYKSGRRLVHVFDGPTIRIRRQLSITDPIEEEIIDDALDVAVYKSLLTPKKFNAVQKDVLTQGLAADESTVRRCLDDLCDRGLIFGEAESFIALGINDVPFRARIPGGSPTLS